MVEGTPITKHILENPAPKSSVKSSWNSFSDSRTPHYGWNALTQKSRFGAASEVARRERAAGEPKSEGAQSVAADLLAVRHDSHTLA